MVTNLKLIDVVYFVKNFCQTCVFIFSGFNFNYIVAFERMHTILKLICYVGVRTRFGLNPKTGMDPGPQNPSNKFVECGIKSQFGSRTKILGYSVRRKELYIHISTKSILGRAPMLSFQNTSSPFFLSPSFTLYTMVSLPFSPSTCELGV